VIQLDQKGSELQLVDTYGQMVNSAAITQLRQVFVLLSLPLSRVILFKFYNTKHREVQPLLQ